MSAAAPGAAGPPAGVITVRGRGGVLTAVPRPEVVIMDGGGVRGPVIAVGGPGGVSTAVPGSEAVITSGGTGSGAMITAWGRAGVSTAVPGSRVVIMERDHRPQPRPRTGPAAARRPEPVITGGGAGS